jgi:transcriptional regulator with XRE-family HTH domain
MAAITNDLETVGGRVAFLRHLKGWSQQELADKAGFKQPSIWALEKNKTKELTARFIWAVAEALGVPAEYLWTGADVTIDEALLLGAFRKLPSEQRLVILRAAGVQPPNMPPERGLGQLGRNH